MLRRYSLPVMLVALAATISLAAAQNREPVRSRQPQRSFSPDRLMENDANGDGKLSPDELPGRMGERLFERGDANGDGFIDREELEKMFAERGGWGGGQGSRGGGGARARGTDSFGDQMGVLARSMRRLSRSNYDSSTLDRDLELISAMQAALIGAKNTLRNVEMSPVGKQMYQADVAGYHKAFRLHLLETLDETLKIERALLEGDSGTARSMVKNLVKLRDRGHELYQPSEDDREKARWNRERDRGGRGQGLGRGKGQGTGATGDDD